MQGTLGSAGVIGILLLIVYFAFKDEVIRRKLYVVCGFLFVIMLFMNRQAAFHLTAEESRNWWPVFVETVKNTSQYLRELIRAISRGEI